MKPLLTAIFTAILAAPAAFAEDCTSCKPGKICPPHDGADEAAIKDATPLLRDKDMEKRREGLDRLAIAAAKHLNARSKKITNEFMRMLADPEATVKGYAAERLGACGEEATAAGTLAAEVAKMEKALAMDKPNAEKKEAELKKWEEQLRTLSNFFVGLAKLTTQPAAAAAFEKGIKSANPWVCKTAAENCKGFKKNKAVAGALITALASYFSKNVTEGNSAAWTAVSMALPEVSQCNDIPTQKDGTDAARWNSQWQKWWRDNEKSLK
ncbi:MAG: hypothetical protein AAB074_03095 [Planctomycetota bacterium]